MHPKIVPVHDFLFSTEFAASKGKKRISILFLCLLLKNKRIHEILIIAQIFFKYIYSFFLFLSIFARKQIQNLCEEIWAIC